MDVRAVHAAQVLNLDHRQCPRGSDAASLLEVRGGVRESAGRQRSSALRDRPAFAIARDDAGGVERARAFAKRLQANLAIIDKRREGPNQTQIMNIIGDVAGKSVLLLDDMIDTAGTIVQGAQACLDHGARDVMTACTHAVLSGPALERLQALYRRAPTMDLLAAIATLDPAPSAQRQRLLAHLQEQPTLSAAQEQLRQSAGEGAPLGPAETQSLSAAVSRAAKPLQRYRCAACGFEAQHYFWQCPGCLSWDSYPPQRVEDL